MSNPQKENGFWQIANEVDESLYVYDFTKNEGQILRFLLRATYGFKQTERRVSLDYISDALGIDKKSTKRAMDKLIENNVIIELEAATRRKARLVKFNKYHDTWKVKKKGLFMAELAAKYPSEFSVGKTTTQSSQNDHTERENSVVKMTTPSVVKMTTQSGQNDYSQSGQNDHQRNTSNTELINTGKDKGQNTLSSSADPNPLIDTDFKELVDYWEANVLNGRSSPGAQNEIGYLSDDYEKELVIEAFNITAANKIKQPKYASGILKTWKASGITTAAQVIAKNEAAAAKQNSNFIDWEGMNLED